MNGLSRKRGRLGWDLEPQLQTHYHSLNHSVALVRQRSRVQIPAKAPLFCKKEEELRVFPVIPLLQLAVTVLQLAVTSVGINPFSISNGSSSSCRTRIFFLISLFIFL